MSHSTLPVEFLKKLQDRIADLAIGPSTLRNQGQSGMIAAARGFLREINLSEFSVEARPTFEMVLEKHTRGLMRQFPVGAKENWGAARKALNIFLRDVLYNRFLTAHYHLERLEPWLELPLDSNTCARLLSDATSKIETWPGVKHLTAESSEKLQTTAECIADRHKVCRVHLDLIYWRSAMLG